MTNCKNCSNTISENYCAQCGHPAKLKRIDRHYILHEIQHLLHVEKGFFYTVKELLIAPGKTIKEYITDSRSRHMKPVPFLVFTSLIYTLIAHYFHVGPDIVYVNNNELSGVRFEQTTVYTIMQWIQHNYGYANIIAGGIIAVWVKIFFRKQDYNIFEINILLCFITGESMLLGAVGILFVALTKSLLIYKIISSAMFVYTIWALGQFFNRTKFTSYLKASLAYALGFISFIIAAIITGIGCDIIKALVHKA